MLVHWDYMAAFSSLGGRWCIRVPSQRNTSMKYLGETSFQATTVKTLCQRFHYLYQSRRLYVTDSVPVVQQNRYRSPYAQAYMDQRGTSVKHNTTKEANAFNQRGISTVAISGWTNHFWRSHDSLSHRVTLAQSDENCTVKRPPQGTPSRMENFFATRMCGTGTQTSTIWDIFG